MAASDLTQKDWDNIELAYFGGQSMNSLAKKYGVSEGTIRHRLKGKKLSKVENAATKVVEARLAVSELPEALRLKVDTIADARMRILEAMAMSCELGAKTAYKLSQIANIKASKLDDESPDVDEIKMVHGLMETSNKAAYQSLEVMKATKGMEQQQEQGSSVADALLAIADKLPD